MSLPAEERHTFIDSQSRDNEALRAELLSLVAHHESSEESFLETPPSLPTNTLIEGLGLQDPYPIGKQVSDFEILDKLGTGGFGTVYLARQVSLDRKVALKVTPNVGEEAKNMAFLEHQNIVRVFSETLEPQDNLRLICMQYVAGPSLADLLAKKPQPNGESYLRFLSKNSREVVPFDIATLKEHERILSFDETELLLWIGAGLADALFYAHERGVLHLDVKPSNVLIHPDGHPLLADFNIAIGSKGWNKNQTPLGGTKNYMAPEQESYFSLSNTPSEKVDPRSDVYSLGSMLVSQLSHDNASADVERILKKATDAKKTARFENAKKFAEALRACLELRQIQKQMPSPSRLIRLVKRYPIWSLFLLTLLPQLFGSIVNISYNSIYVVDELSSIQQRTFAYLCVFYNLIFYPLGIWVMFKSFLPIAKAILKKPPKQWSQSRLRKRILNLPYFFILASSVGWLPGVLFFPTGIDHFAGPIPGQLYLHFAISFFLSWVVALTYSFLTAQFLGLRVLYPNFWVHAVDIRETAQIELSSTAARVRFFHFCAGIVPLLAAMLVLFVGSAKITIDHYLGLKFILGFLMALGILGFVLSLRVTRVLEKTLYALTGK